MTDRRSWRPTDVTAIAARVAEDLFCGAAERDATATFPSGALAALHAAGLMLAPFPARLGGAGLVEAEAVDRLRDVLRLIGGGDLSVGRLYEGHVNAVALVARYGTPSQLSRLAADVHDGALSGVWNAEGATPVTLEAEGRRWGVARHQDPGVRRGISIAPCRSRDPRRRDRHDDAAARRGRAP